MYWRRSTEAQVRTLGCRCFYWDPPTPRACSCHSAAVHFLLCWVDSGNQPLGCQRGQLHLEWRVVLNRKWSLQKKKQKHQEANITASSINCPISKCITQLTDRTEMLVTQGILAQTLTSPCFTTKLWWPEVIPAKPGLNRKRRIKKKKKKLNKGYQWPHTSGETELI